MTDGDIIPPDPSTLVIQAARLEDAGALLDLMNLPGVRHGTLRLPFTAVEEAKRWIEGTTSNDRLLLAWLDGEAAGWASLTRFPGRLDHKAYLHMAVRDGRTGRGLGSALMGALIDLADRWMGLRRLELDVNVDNEAARKFYERFGFEVEGVRREFMLRDGVYVDACAMGRLSPLRGR